MRSFLVEPMTYGRLFLAGDAAHIFPPTGAKGLNLAVHDVFRLSQALVAYQREASSDGLAGCSEACLGLVWRAQELSIYMTELLHRLDDDPFTRGLQSARLRYVWSSTAAARSLAEN